MDTVQIIRISKTSHYMLLLGHIGAVSISYRQSHFVTRLPNSHMVKYLTACYRTSPKGCVAPDLVPESLLWLSGSTTRALRTDILFDNIETLIFSRLGAVTSNKNHHRS